MNGIHGTPLELGATWFSNLHVSLSELIDELGLIKYPQYSGGISLFQTKSFEPPQEFFVPAADAPSFRIAGGTQMLTDTLAQKLNREHIHLNKKVTSIGHDGNGLIIGTADGSALEADQAVVCIPPQLAAAAIRFLPALPESLMQVLPAVQTWMAGAVKFTLEYSKPFWREKGYSGMLYSHAGIVTEMYDHTSFEGDKYGLTGFLNSSAALYSQEIRKEFVLRQLSGLLGDMIMQPTAYFDKVWNDSFLIHGNQTIIQPHQNNGHPALSSGYMDGRLHFCVTEAAAGFPGYMEGAVRSAISVSGQV